MSIPLVKRIDRALKVAAGEDADVLAYVRAQIHPDAVRDEDHQDVAHLIEVANRRLRHYEPKEA